MLTRTQKNTFDKLMATYLSNGVQPSDLAENMFDESYLDLEVTKEDAQIILVLSFCEIGDEDRVIVKMRYTYAENKKLLRVEQKIGRGVYKVQWDRQLNLISILDELLGTAGSKSAFDKLISQLPLDLQLLTHRKLVA